MIKSKNRKLKAKRPEKVSDFSLMDKILIISTSVVSFGGFVFCAIMIILMNAIEY